MVIFLLITVFNKNNVRYLPSRDLADIYYKFTNKTEVTKYALDRCSYTQYLIVLIEK